MPRLSLPREAPRALVPRSMPSKIFNHSFCVYLPSDGIYLSNDSYTDAIHNQYFVNKSWSVEAMLQGGFLNFSSILFTDEPHRRPWNMGQPTAAGISLWQSVDGAVSSYYTDSSGAVGGWKFAYANNIPRRSMYHLVISYSFNEADPTQSIFRVYHNGYKYHESIHSEVNITRGDGRFYSYRKSGSLEICSGELTAWKYFRMISGNPWPVNGFEIASRTIPFAGSGNWMPGVTGTPSYPTIDPSLEIMKFDFQNTVDIANIRDLSLNNFQVESVGSRSFIQYTKNDYTFPEPYPFII